MQTSSDLKALLGRIDRRGYPAYKDTKGAYRFSTYVLSIDHVQGDPFAAPSRLSIHVDGKTAAFPPELYELPCQRIALQDALTRRFGHQAEQISYQAKGSGHSGLIAVSRCGQEVLEREDAAKEELTAEGVTFVDVDNAAFTEHFSGYAEANFPDLADWCNQIRALAPNA